MTSMDFDPERAYVLDGYNFVQRVYPRVNLNDMEACRGALGIILGQVDLVPVNGQDNDGFWLQVCLKGTVKVPSDGLLSLVGFYALNVLSPSGELFRTFNQVDSVTAFDFDGVPYFMGSFGANYCLVPSLDKKFLQFYEEKDAYFPYQYSN